MKRAHSSKKEESRRISYPMRATVLTVSETDTELHLGSDKV